MTIKNIEIVSLPICTGCGEIILPQTGYIIKGNIYAVTTSIDNKGGLIGNCFPANPDSGMINVKEIGEVAYHGKCLNAVLNPSLLPHLTAPTHR